MYTIVDLKGIHSAFIIQERRRWRGHTWWPEKQVTIKNHHWNVLKIVS